MAGEALSISVPAGAIVVAQAEGVPDVEPGAAAPEAGVPAAGELVEGVGVAEEAGEENTARLYRKTDMLSVIGAIAPMLGLFGTVEGMMEAFNTIAMQEKVYPRDLADSISKALVTTWLGLIVAIPSLIAWSYYNRKVERMAVEIASLCDEFLRRQQRQRR